MINTKHLLKVLSVWTSIIYIICYLGVAIYPSIRNITVQYALHMKVSFASNFFGFGYFISGLIIWNTVAILGVWLFATLFNKIKQ